MTSHRAPRRRVLLRWLPTVVVVLAVIAGGIALSRFHGPRPRLAEPPSPTSAAAPVHAPSTPATSVHQPAARVATVATAAPSPCQGNTAAQHVIVSIAEQHAWICAGSRQVRDSAVTTGAIAVGDGTPTGTWHVQAKQTDRMLTVLGGASYHVDYWMPYDGMYGFHDAAWQTFPYGSPLYKTRGSHGCVHLPRGVMAWLYSWAKVGATVTVQA